MLNSLSVDLWIVLWRPVLVSATADSGINYIRKFKEPRRQKKWLYKPQNNNTFLGCPLYDCDVKPFCEHKKNDFPFSVKIGWN